MEFRIGINLGDVVEEGERIYGDGVNIAARVEGLAEPGGICVSGSAFEQVKTKLDLGYEHLGEQRVKNIAEPVRVYRVLMEPEAAGKVIGEKRPRLKQWQWLVPATAVAVVLAVAAVWYFSFRPTIEPASVEAMAFPLPDKPSIAVLPFVNMSGDEKQEYITDGITDNIITTLSKVHELFVISSSSSFTYKGKPVKTQQVSEELGVQYVLEGSVQRSGDRVRVIAQLIDAIDGKHLWSERFDRDFEDIFELQDELASRIANSLRVELVLGEEAKLWQKNRPSNLQFNEIMFEADYLAGQFNKEDNIRAKQLYKEAIDLEPEHWDAYVGLATTHVMDVHLGLSSSPGESLDEAIKLCNKSMTLDESQDWPHHLLGHIYSLSREFDEAIAEFELAIALNPNSATAYDDWGRTLVYAGRPEEGIDLIKKGMRLNPLNPLTLRSMTLPHAYREAGQYEEAINEYKRCIKSNPNYIVAHQALTSTYALAGRYEEAREAWSEVLKLDPTMTVEKAFPKPWPYGPEHLKRQIAVLHKAGIK